VLRSLIHQRLFTNIGDFWSELHDRAAIKLISFLLMVLQADLEPELTEQFFSFIIR
jgi:hypothetical protein